MYFTDNNGVVNINNNDNKLKKKKTKTKNTPPCHLNEKINQYLFKKKKIK